MQIPLSPRDLGQNCYPPRFGGAPFGILSSFFLLSSSFRSFFLSLFLYLLIGVFLPSFHPFFRLFLLYSFIYLLLPFPARLCSWQGPVPKSVARGGCWATSVRAPSWLWSRELLRRSRRRRPMQLRFWMGWSAHASACHPPVLGGIRLQSTPVLCPSPSIL